MEQIIDKIELTTQLKQAISIDLAKSFKIIPKAFHQDEIELWVDKELYSEETKSQLGVYFGKEVNFFPVESAVLNRALSEYYFADKYADKKEINAENNFIEDIIEDANTIGSSDIHIEIYETQARVRMRVDGQLIERFEIPKQQYSSIINQIKVKANLLTEEQRLPQDGRISYRNNNYNFDLRVSIIPTIYGEKVVMRILGKGAYAGEIDNLGLSINQEDILRKEISKKEGIILISGPTGSGKTTTLYAILSHLNSQGRNISTIEDPVEYILDGINQVQLNESIGLTFPKILSSFLRQDPNILMVGEIRDADTARMAIRLAMTGHLVLSTIHTNSAKETITRLTDIGIENFSVASTLNLSIAQRLIRKLCEHCKTKQTANDMVSEIKLQDYNLFAANGCEKCHFTGYKGRIALFEMLPVDNEIKRLIRLNELTHKESNELGYSSLKNQAIETLKKGLTSIDEVYPMIQ